MKKYILTLCCIGYAFATVYAQEFPKPKLASPENAFYNSLDNKKISDPTQFNGNVKKVVRTLKEYQEGVHATTVQKETMQLNTDGQLETTIRSTYTYGIEDSKEVTNHLETPKATIKKEGAKTLKIIKQTPSEEDEYLYNPDFKGDDHYVYENERLVAFYNNTDSISYTYDAQNRLIEIKMYESFVAEQFDDETGETTFFRSAFQEKGLQKVIYRNELPVQKISYDKFGEVIDVYKKTYTYSANKQLEKFETEYKRYLFDYYVDSIAIEQQSYAEFPKVETNDSIQTGTFHYSPTKKITAYKRDKGEETETYKVTYDVNDRMHIVEGTLVFYQNGNLVTLPVEYEYIYGTQGNPKTIQSFYYLQGEKILHKETIFEIEYYYIKK